MLRLLRQGGVTKAIMGIVVVLIIAAFAFTSVGPGMGVSATQCVVEVEGSCVQPKDYNMLMRLVAPRGATDKELRKMGFTGFAVNALIERELLLREARRLGVSVSEDALDDELALGRVHYSWPVEAPIPSSVARGYPFPTAGATPMVQYIRVRNTKTDAFDFDVYRRQIQNLLRMSPREFKERQETELVAARVRELITAGVRVSEDEAFADFERQRSKATIRSVNIRNSWFERFVVDGSDTAAEAYQKANAEAVDSAWEREKDNWQADCPLISEVLLQFSPDADDDERAEKKESAEDTKKILDGGAALSDVARAFSTGPTARSGGAVGCLDAEKYGAGGAELLAAIETLRPGTTSKVIETPRGFHIVRFLGTLSAEQAEQRGRLELARRLAIQDAAKAASKQYAEELLGKVKGGAELSATNDELIAAKVNTSGLSADEKEALLQTAKLASDLPAFEVSRPFTRTSSPLPGLRATDVASRVFALEKEDALIAEPLETYTGHAVIQLKEKDMAERKDFDEEKDEMMSALKEQKRAEALARYIDRLRERATSIVVNPAYDKAPTDSSTSDAEPAGSG